MLFLLLLFLEISSKKSRCASFSGPQMPRLRQIRKLDPPLSLWISDRPDFSRPPRGVGASEKPSRRVPFASAKNDLKGFCPAVKTGIEGIKSL